MSRYLKAIFGAAAAGVAAALSYLPGGGSSVALAVLYGVSAALSAFAVVWAVPNARPKVKPKP